MDMRRKEDRLVEIISSGAVPVAAVCYCLQLLVVVVVVVAPTTALILPAGLPRISLCPNQETNRNDMEVDNDNNDVVVGGDGNHPAPDTPTAYGSRQPQDDSRSFNVITRTSSQC